uniref:G patch domain-containing protein 11 n=1 Tax=Culicoides sonorensis TaxID=179676 RepID=A0A336KQQ0_CULSO
MSSDEEDYMSDKILAACTSSNKGNDVRPGLIHNHSRKREHQIAVKKARLDEDNKKKLQPSASTRLQEGLSTSISSSNKGFAMLQKMGYKEGQALGKTESGIVEPIGIQVKNDRGGLGREAAIKEIQEYRAQARLKQLNKGREIEQMTPEEYRRLKSLKSQSKQINIDLIKSQKACEGLDRSMNVGYPVMKWFWPENRLPIDPNEEEDAEEEEEEEKFENQEKLEMLTRYLRSCYFYCIHCGIKYENATDFQTNCPGDTRDDH